MSRALSLHLVSFLALTCLATSPVSAGEPPVQFDAPEVLSAVPLDDSPVVRKLPHTRHFEIVLPVSTFVRSRTPLAPYQLLCLIQFPSSDIQIVDFSPQTELTTSYVGPLQIDRQHETTQSLGLSLTGKFNGWSSGQATGEVSGRRKEQQRATESPPMMLLQASGTVNRGTGVYFKFRPSRQTTLEGSRDLRVVIEVPADWRISTMRLQCRAEPIDSPEPSLGETLMPVVIYAMGDDVAGDAARRFVAAERAFRRQWVDDNRKVRAAAKSTRLRLDVLDLLPSLVSHTPPSYDTVIDTLVFRRNDTQGEQLLERLPQRLRVAAQAVVDAHAAIEELAGRFAGPAESP